MRGDRYLMSLWVLEIKRHNFFFNFLPFENELILFRRPNYLFYFIFINLIFFWKCFICFFQNESQNMAPPLGKKYWLEIRTLITSFVFVPCFRIWDRIDIWNHHAPKLTITISRYHCAKLVVGLELFRSDWI